MRYAGILCGVLLAAGVGGVREVQACGAIAEPINYFTFADPSPESGGEGVYLDSPIVLRGHAWSIGGSPIVLSGFNVEAVMVTDPDGLSVEGQWSTEERSAEFASSVWRHNALLAPNTEYTVSAVLAPQDPPRPPEATSTESIEFSFTTGSQSAPPLLLDGEITVRLEQTTMPVLTCDGVCGSSNCVETGVRAALLAHVTLPGVHGGIDYDGYDGFVMFTDNTPAEFSGPGGDVSTDEHIVMLMESVRPEAGAESEVVFEVMDEDEAYRPCFSYNVWDVRGENVAAPAVCLGAIRPRDILTENGPVLPPSVPGQGTVPAEPVEAMTVSETTSSGGCSFVAASTRGSSGFFVFTALGACCFVLRSRSGRRNAVRH